MHRDASEREALYKRLSPEGREHARVTILSDIIDKADNARTGLTPDSLATQMQKYSKQIDTFFKGDERKQLEGFLDLLKYTRYAQEAEVSLQTGQQLVPAVIGGSIAIDPITNFIGIASVGQLAKIYESPRVRDALLKVRAARGDARDVAIREAIDEVQAVAQAIMPDEAG